MITFFHSISDEESRSLAIQPLIDLTLTLFCKRYIV